MTTKEMVIGGAILALVVVPAAVFVYVASKVKAPSGSVTIAGASCADAAGNPAPCQDGSWDFSNGEGA